MRQVNDRQGRMINPWQVILLFLALLAFIFTVVYRMVKSASFSNALAIMFEYLLVLVFFTLLGILLAYLFYFIYQNILKGTHHLQNPNMFDSGTGPYEVASKSDQRPIKLESKNEVESKQNS